MNNYRHPSVDDEFCLKRPRSKFAPAALAASIVLFGALIGWVVTSGRLLHRGVEKREEVFRPFVPDIPDPIKSFKPVVKFLDPPFPSGILCRFKESRPEDLTIGPDGRFLALTGAAGAIILDLENKKELYHLPARRVVFSPDRQRIAAVVLREIIIWDLLNGERSVTLKHPADNEFGAAVFSPDGTRLATTSRERAKGHAGVVPDQQVLRIWDLPAGHARVQANLGDDVINSIIFSADGTSVYSWFVNFQHLTCWDANTGTARKKDMPPVSCMPDSILLLPEGPRVLGALTRGALRVNALALGDLEQGTVLHEMETPGGRQWPISWSPNGKWAAFRSQHPRDEVVILDVQAWRQRGVLKIDPGFGIAITSDGNSLFAMSDGLLRQWDLRELK